MEILDKEKWLLDWLNPDDEVGTMNIDLRVEHCLLACTFTIPGGSPPPLYLSRTPESSGC